MFFRHILLAFVALAAGSISISAQAEPEAKETPKEPEIKVDLTKEQTDGRQVAESSIIVYSGLRGREGLDQVRKTAVEIGRTSYSDPDGKTRRAEYVRRVIRGTSFVDEKVRLDQKFPDAEFALVFEGGRIYGIISDTVFSPRDDAERSFRNEIVHGIAALLRYKENGANVELLKSEKVMGVDYYVVELTDKDNFKTTYFISKKTLRVLMLEYEDGGVKYQRRFYDHNYAQGTLVPYRTVLKADGKEIEESTIATITFGQTVEESFFALDAQ